MRKQPTTLVAKRPATLVAKKLVTLDVEGNLKGWIVRVTLGSSSHQNKSISNHNEGNISKQPTTENGGVKPNVMVAPPSNVHGLPYHPILG
jgi:hypothetical protein